MLDLIADLATGRTTAVPFVIVAVALSALIATRVSRLILRRVIRHLARQSVRAGVQLGWWRVRDRRSTDESGAMIEQRRRQRIDAATRMLNHLASVVIWIVAAIVTFHLLDINPAFFLSSAGFIGAGLAIGGQHKVNDYLTGLSVHVEDRYGIGDEIEAEVGWGQPIRGVVDHIGLVSTRVRDERSTLHFSNSALVNLRNLSQEAAVTTLRVRLPDHVDGEAAAATLRGLAGQDGLTDVIFVGDLAAQYDSTGEVAVDVRTSRTLDERSRDQLVARAERALAGRDR